MDWEGLGKKIIGIGAPLLGGALGGPGGAAVGSLLAKAVGAKADDPDDISKKIQADPAALVKLRAIELSHREKLEKLAVKRAQIATEAELSNIREVNATMRSEADSEHWPQYSWRPSCRPCDCNKNEWR